MKKQLLITMLFIISAFISKGQGWEKLFSHQSTDVLRSVQEVSTGGYIAAGYTADSTANDTDAYVVRLNTSGDTIWTYTYNGALSKKDLFYKIIEVSSGGFLAMGYTNSVTGISDDILYIRLSATGQQQWVKTWGSNETERGQDVVETSTGFTIVGYATSLSSYYDAVILNTDFNGTINWTKTIGTSDYEDANAVKLLPDGGYILGGQCRVNGNYDMYLIRTNANGDTLWTKSLGTPGVDNIESITLAGNAYVLAGSNTDAITGSNGYVVKVDTSGNVLWSKTFGGSDQDDFHRVEPTNDGGFILAGTCASYGTLNPNLWLFKIDASGDSVWAHTYGGDSHDHGYSAVQTSDGGYILAGHTGSFGYQNEDGIVIKTDANGTPPHTMRYVRAYELQNPLCTGQGLRDVQVVVRNFGYTTENNVHLTVNVTGATTATLNATISSIASQSFQVITLTPQLNTSPGGNITFDGSTDVPNDVYPIHNSFTKTISTCTSIDDLIALDYVVYPNPTSNRINIQFGTSYDECKIELFNSNGAIVKSQISPKGNMQETIDANDISQGIYLLKVSTKDGFDLRRIVVE